MKKPIKRAPRAKETLDKQTFGIASIYINAEWDEENQTLIGIRMPGTASGVNFEPEIEYFKKEVAGASGFDIKGDKIITGANIAATATIAGETSALLQKISKSDVIKTASGRTILQPRTTIKEHDYIDRISLVSWHDDNDFTVIELDNVLITSNFNFETEENVGRTIEVRMKAHMNVDEDGYLKLSELPYRIITPKRLDPSEDELQLVEGGDSND